MTCHFVRLDEGAADDGQQREGEGQLAGVAVEAQRHQNLSAMAAKRSYIHLIR